MEEACEYFHAAYVQTRARERSRARRNTAKYAAELRLYTRTRMFESGATSAFRVCVSVLGALAHARLCISERAARERHADCAVVCRRRAALGRLA